MRRRIALLLLVLSVGVPRSAQAQVLDWVTNILTAARLPVVAVEARREGISDADIRAALDAMRRSGVSPHEATWVFDTIRVVRREHGPVDNFGAFVQSQLAEGKRGRELAAAIRAEHARMGKGNAARGGRDEERDKDDKARGAPGQGRGRDDTARVRDRGKPDTDRGRAKRDSQPSGRQGPPSAKPNDRGRGRPNPDSNRR